MNAKAPYEVWLHHAYYCHDFLEVVSDPKLLVSIVRRPALRFRSAWVWYSHEDTLKVTLKQFVSIITTAYTYLDCYLPIYTTTTMATKCHDFKYRTGLDATSEELTGYPKTSLYFKTKYDQLISSIYDRKIFLLVADRLDESLLVLGKLIGLKMTSLLYASQKVLASKQDDSTNDKDMLNDLDTIQPYDLKLYKAANDMLDCYIKDYYHHHEKFSDDLYTFRLANGRVQGLCQKLLQTNDSTTITTCLLYTSPSPRDS